MSVMTQKMSEASNKVPVDAGVGSPKKGEIFRCEKCGMEVKITADCRCENSSMVHFHCCGQELAKT